MTSEEKKNIYKAVLETLNGIKTYESDDLLKLVKLIEEDNKENDFGITLKKVK